MEDLLEAIAWLEDPLAECAGQPVIPATNFDALADLLAAQDTDLTVEEIALLIDTQSKRFSACGANNSEKYAVLRKNPKGGWQYLVTLINQEESTEADS